MRMQYFERRGRSRAVGTRFVDARVPGAPIKRVPSRRYNCCYDLAGRPVLTVSTAETAASSRLDGADSRSNSPARNNSLFFTDTPASRHFSFKAAIFA